MLRSTERFSSRVENYVRYRPGYPAGALDWIDRHGSIGPDGWIADIGCGTGIFARLMLERGWNVWGVEPNPDMRLAGERLLDCYPSFRSIAGTAEHSNLPDASVEGIVAAQAFHWFDPAPTRAEWKRILKPQGWAAIIWNARLTEETPFLLGYENLLRTFCPEYEHVEHRNVDPAKLEAFFQTEPSLETFANSQEFDYAALEGRLLSSSYAPESGQPRHDEMLAELRRLFDACQEKGRVSFLYRTECYWGQFES